jgi:hypothetical protein
MASYLASGTNRNKAISAMQCTTATSVDDLHASKEILKMRVFLQTNELLLTKMKTTQLN